METKTVSNRKSRKEGPVSNCVACSLTNVMFGLRLRTQGISQERNVESLLSTLPKLTSQNQQVWLTFDRGYGKLSFVESQAEKYLG